MTTLFQQIDAMLTAVGHGWTTPEEATALACSIMALRPSVSVEIGVYAGKGLISMGLAHRETGKGIAIGIDPYSRAASKEGQLKEEDATFWGNLDHDLIFKMAAENIVKFGVLDYVKLVRKTSQQADIPPEIGVLRIDGNHGLTVEADVRRWSPAVVKGGFLMLDDLEWTGGAVLRAAAWLRQSGWKELYQVGTGMVLQKP